MAQGKRGAGESLIPFFSHPTLHFSKVTLANSNISSLWSSKGGAMEFGNLTSYGPDLDELFRQSTKYVDRIVRGTNPSGLPEEFPARICAHFNLKIAKALVLTIQGDRWARICRKAGARRSTSSTASWRARAKRSAFRAALMPC